MLGLKGDNVPCERLLVHVADGEFARTYRIEAGGPVGSDRPFRVIATGEWRRRAGEPPAPLEARWSEVTANRLRVVVTDHRNPPLRLERAEYAAGNIHSVRRTRPLGSPALARDF